MQNLMVVDDNSDIRALLKLALTREGYKVTTAENGHIAKQILCAGLQTCVVLLDLMMPIMNGKEFLEWKNADPNVSSIPVVVISAQPDKTLRGIVTTLRKPIELPVLLDHTEKICVC